MRQTLLYAASPYMNLLNFHISNLNNNIWRMIFVQA